MEVTQVLHMNKGDGETSYAKNSTVQNEIISMAKSMTAEAVRKLLSTNVPESLGIADLGCSSGPNSLLVISDIIDAIQATCFDLNCPSPELSIFLNDLPTNDFNYTFGLLPGFYEELKSKKGFGFERCFVSGLAGSFYGRLFPRRSLHFVHSSSSLHWLSQVPAGLEGNGFATTNKGKLYISKTSHESVLKAYAFQFQKDFSVFLKSRSEELVPGGRMVLSFIGRGSMDPTTEESCYHWELLAQALMEMAREGIIEEEKIDSFNAPYYAPCPEELKLVIEKDSSFEINRLEAFEIDWDGGEDGERYNDGVDMRSKTVSRGQRVARTVRAVVESMFESHFGENLNMDDLFARYGEIVGDYVFMGGGGGKYVNLIVSLVRKC